MPCLQLARGGHDRAVDVEVDHLAEQVSAPRPRHNAGRTELIASINATTSASVEAAQEVSRRGRVRQQLGPSPFISGTSFREPVDVLQPGAAGEHAVGQGEHVIGLVIRQVHLIQYWPR